MNLQQQDQCTDQNDAPTRRCATCTSDGRLAFHAMDYIQHAKSLSTRRQ